ncbi:MAG: 4Fe-4S binding protein [Bacteroidales bacterium]|nr:4Fe-4S binding protein [Bacteroidales bacterium]
MIREMVKIDEELCNGCGECVPACHEGALQIIDGKARLISDLMCDGLGACIGHCPVDAITIEKREAEPYNETKVMEIMVEKGKNTVIAHMKHLKEHGETGFLKEAVHFLRDNDGEMSFSVQEVIREVHNHGHAEPHSHRGSGGCPGSQERTLAPKGLTVDAAVTAIASSELRQWPVQMHLINPAANYFKNSDVVIAADCVAFSMGNFHQRFLKGKTLAIACPKLDEGQETYVQKITRLIDEANVNTITVVIMQVPCCGGLLQVTKKAAAQAIRKVPVKVAVISVEGEVLQEEWV